MSRVTGTIWDLNPDLLSVQEAQPNKWDNFREELDEFEWHGVGRDAGEREGEFWFSEIPDEPGSVGWDADLPRVAV